MLKICPRCHKTFSGGRLCPAGCGAPLLDVADPSTRPLLREKELQHTINTYYGARTAMLALFGGILFGLMSAALLVRQGFLAGRGQGTGWFAAAGIAFPAFVGFALFAGYRVVHFFSAVCRGRPPTIDDLRITLRERRGLR